MDNKLSDRLSDAIRSGDFETAAPLIQQYGQAIALQMHQARSLDERKMILEEALQLLRDRIHLARTMRAHLAAQLKMTTGAFHYGSSSAPEKTSWHCEG